MGPISFEHHVTFITNHTSSHDEYLRSFDGFFGLLLAELKLPSDLFEILFGATTSKPVHNVGKAGTDVRTNDQFKGINQAAIEADVGQGEVVAGQELLFCEDGVNGLQPLVDSLVLVTLDRCLIKRSISQKRKEPTGNARLQAPHHVHPLVDASQLVRRSTVDGVAFSGPRNITSDAVAFIYWAIRGVHKRDKAERVLAEIFRGLVGHTHLEILSPLDFNTDVFGGDEAFPDAGVWMAPMDDQRRRHCECNK